MIVVLYNYIFGQTIVLIDPHKDELNVMMNHCEYGFIELFTIQSANQDILEHIKLFWNPIHAVDDNPKIIKLWEENGIPTTKIGTWDGEH